MSQHIAVVGAGVIGICTALKALEKGFKVTLIDPEAPGNGCSSGNAGHFATEQVFPLADPALLSKIPSMLLNPLGPLTIRPRYFFKVLPWLFRFLAQMPKQKRQHNTRVLRTICEAALPAWRALLTRYQLQQHITLNGSLLVFETTPQHEIENLARQYAKQNVSVKILYRPTLEKLEPGLSPSVNAALYFDQVGHTSNPRALSQALFDEFEKLGGRYLQKNVIDLQIKESVSQTWSLKFSDEKKSAVSEDKEPEEFDSVIISSGVFSARLCARMGYKLPLEAERGYHLNTQPGTLPQRPVASFERKFIMTPMTMGLRLAGTVEFAGIDAEPNPKRADNFYEHGCSIWPALTMAEDPRKAENRWMGHRPSLPDSLPIISRAKEPNLYFNFGHQHLGLTLAAISADQVMALIENKNIDHEAALSVQRFTS